MMADGPKEQQQQRNHFSGVICYSRSMAKEDL